MKVLITGVDGGLGSALSTRYMDDGFEVYGILGDRYESGAWEVKSQIESMPCPDILINCHGTNRLAVIGGGPDLSIYRIMDINVNMMYLMVDHLKRVYDKPIRVLNIASIAYRVPMTTTALYCASKAAVVQLTKVMARELAPHGWVINCLSSGKMDNTEMSSVTDEQVSSIRGWSKQEADAHALSTIPMGRFTNTAEVCDAVRQILELPSYINGACIDMAGGI